LLAENNLIFSFKFFSAQQPEHVYRFERDNLVHLELMFALFGSVYRLQELLSSWSRSEQERMECEVLAGKTLAYAQRLDVCIWMLTSGLNHMRTEKEFPVSVIETTSKARRKAVGNDYLLIDHLWHHMNTGAPTGLSFFFFSFLFFFFFFFFYCSSEWTVCLASFVI
jgi:hypothetical protein